MKNLKMKSLKIKIDSNDNYGSTSYKINCLKRTVYILRYGSNGEFFSDHCEYFKTEKELKRYIKILINTQMDYKRY